jgi:hypothetical protein
MKKKRMIRYFKLLENFKVYLELFIEKLVDLDYFIRIV